MLDFKLVRDEKTGAEWIETSLTGKPLLTTPQLNKGTAFTENERHDFDLRGKLPVRIETLQEQVARAYLQYRSQESQLKKNIYLHDLHNNNQILFYALVKKYITEMLPTIYTPIVGTRVKEFSHEFRQARGLYITHHDQNFLDEILANRSNPEIDLIVVTDGEGVLGIGDQGIGAMDIPVAKLMVYSLCGAVDPVRTLPILLDVGTNNQTLLDDSLYLGLRHPRITGKNYDDFIAAFVTAIKRKFPNVFLHWEDFGRQNARHNLDRFRETICSFNDDIQGTGVVALAALLAATKANHSRLAEQRIVVFGAGTAGTGITDQICAAMTREGLATTEARAQFWLVDRSGLLTQITPNLTPEQQIYARKTEEIKSWSVNNINNISLLEVITQIKPTVLIGTSGCSNAFSQEIVQAMAANGTRPIIFPLSNPTENAEATPQDLLDWTHGNVLIATGSPFEPVHFKGKSIPISQCNNSFAFPGIGWGAIAVKAKKISDDMLWAACNALSECSPALKNPEAPLLPNIDALQDIAIQIAIAVAKAAEKEGLATVNQKIPVETLVKNTLWKPQYLPYRKK